VQTLAAIFSSQGTFGGIFTQIFSKSNLLGVRLHPPHPTSNSTAFHNSIIGNFVVYQDRLEINLLQLFGHLENAE